MILTMVLILLLVSKNHKPQWKPSSINKINYDELNKMFEPI